jgi:guanylate kinase
VSYQGSRLKAQGSKGKIFVVSGPSGSGKTTLVKKLLTDKPLKKILAKSVSFTTRPRRSGEVGGRDYVFINAAEFLRLRREKKILEWTRYLGYYYGTAREFAERRIKEGRHILLCLDKKGADRLKRLYPRSTVTIFILPPSIKTLRQRIKARCCKTRQEEIRARLRLARKEILLRSAYDYALVNDNLQQAQKALRALILQYAANSRRE